MTIKQQKHSHFTNTDTHHPIKFDLKSPTHQKPVAEVVDGKSGFGIVYFLYGSQDQLQKYLKEVLQSAETYWRVEPNISIALISTDPTIIHETDHHFTHIVKIPQEINYSGRQWLTRIESLSLTPFMTTLAVDSDTFACTKLSDDLKLAHLSVQYDYAFTGYHNHYNKTILMDAGTMLMRWTPGTKRLLKEWAKVHKEQMTKSKQDDQVSLVLALLSAKKRNMTLKVARLDYSYGLRWYGAKGEGWINRRFEHTMVTHGEVRTIHMRAMYPSYRLICKIINEESLLTRPRLLTVDRKLHSDLYGKVSETQLRSGFQLAFSTNECAYQLNGAECRDMDWHRRDILTPLDNMLRPALPSVGKW
ncbi:unnamed protein product [Adineta steineri]|uniref:Uncharacterized protein n=1 Tax=Adineta steineri TaxID=433720 RepID=A0A819H895_9BILA|nr:unnamed protein product [Adineta steineri]